MTSDQEKTNSPTVNDSMTIYVLSSDDIERIDTMMQLLRVGFLELLESRKVRFPNALSVDPSSAEEKLYEEKNRIVSEWVKSREF